MKKIVISLILALSVVSSAYAEVKSPQMRQAIRQYKSGDFTGAVQTLEDLTDNDSGNALAHYYLGMCYVQTGYIDDAKDEYENVIKLKPDSQLAKNAQTGITNLTATSAPTVKTIKPKIKPKKGFFSDEVKNKIQEQNIKTIIENTNNNRKTNPDLYNRIENLDPKKSSSSNNAPTKEQIAEALQILTKAGLNPASPATAQIPQINPEMMQMNMLMSAFGNNGNNNMNGNSMTGMMPYLMMMQNGQGNNKPDKEAVQAMMSNMMMPNMMNLYENNNNNNN